MNDEPPIASDLDEFDQELESCLRIARPVPPAAFRGRLGRHLAERDPGYGPRPERLRLIAVGYLGAGGLLIALVAVGFP